ncbi:MAG: transcriptional repressor NrdR [Alphaproteobacteria bacterium]|nr:MAG: transcriptional repressor NrdR [Alphaproteobacteria bacterium]TAF74996.1 MAG: transcriptional repressor NrdR [Alphaproteobacteria bacterium]
MKCPYCGHHDTQVKDSRPSEDGTTIKRRRHCSHCDARFTTLERVQLRELVVVKRDGTRKPFDRDKIMRSMLMATRKRPIQADALEQAVNRIVRELEHYGTDGADVPSPHIGEMVMDALRTLDQVAYIRYASVYRDFTEKGDFEAFVKHMDGGEER